MPEVACQKLDEFENILDELEVLRLLGKLILINPTQEQWVQAVNFFAKTGRDVATVVNRRIARLRASQGSMLCRLTLYVNGEPTPRQNPQLPAINRVLDWHSVAFTSHSPEPSCARPSTSSFSC
jgi:hypothetical protein